MEDRTVVRIVRLGVAIGGVLAVVGSAATIVIAGLRDWWLAFGGFMLLFSLFFGVFVWIVIARQPRNRVVWVLGGVGLGSGVWLGGLGGAVLLAHDDPVQIAALVTTAVVPGDLGSGAAIVKLVTEAVGVPPLIAGLTLGLLLLPDGELPAGRRWRWFAAMAYAAIGLTFLAGLWAYRPSNPSSAVDDPLYGVAVVVSAIAIVLAASGLISRFRASSGSTREQFKWVVWGAATFVPTTVVSAVLSGTAYEPISLAAMTIGSLAFMSGLAIAVGRYRLFDVDVVIRRTAVVAGLAAFITVVYAVFVGAVGLVVGFSTEATLPLSIAATVVVAVAFQPLRDRMRRWADRLVYGERASPYEVLSRFSSQMRDVVATEDVLPTMAELLAAGTDADRAVVWLKTGDELRPAAVWPAGQAIERIAVADMQESFDEGEHMALVEHDAEVLGAVSVAMPGREEMSASARRLVEDIASQAGLVLRNARLVEELRSSRQRLVAAQDEERRRLERDLHDGAQQQFVAVKMKAGIARQLTAHGESARAAEILDEVLADVDAGVESLRELAHGIYPPLLEAEGLPAALRSRVRRGPIEVSIDADGLGRYPREIEAAVYFGVLEALQNAAKYSHADKVVVTLRPGDGRLAFEVVDDGDGFDPATQARGRGLTNMRDRIDALGGTLAIRSSPGEGTTITGTLGATPLA